MHWIREAFRRSFDYSGRSRRKEYWSYALFAFVLLNIVSVIETKLGWRAPRGAGGRDGSLFGSIVLVTLVVPGLAVAVRRLHDSGRAGWWLALPAAPILFWIVALIGGFSSPGLFKPVLVAILVTPLVILVLMCLPGTRGPNRFGPDPKGVDLADIFA
ncbi:MAG TPA: DUF805 domain-containing protein [Allosphingosinicella sp.]|nr:DUF805 domain-containing protein [Allosphingosinicella sp.]